MSDQAPVAEMSVAFERSDHLDAGDMDRTDGGMEHRLGTRMRISLPVKLHQAGKTPAFGQILNVSLSGAFVRTSANLGPLARIGIVCEHVYSEAAGAACVTAFVTRVAADGVALEWLEFAPPVIRHLMRREQPRTLHGFATSKAAKPAAGTMTGSPGRVAPLAGTRPRPLSGISQQCHPPAG